MSDEEIESGSHLAEAIKTRDAIEVLMRSTGWQLLDSILAEREAHMIGALLDPGQEISDLALREYRMVITTLRSTRQTPAAMLEDAEESILTLRKIDDDDYDAAAGSPEYGEDDVDPS